MTEHEEKMNDEQWYELGDCRYGEIGVIRVKEPNGSHCYNDLLGAEDEIVGGDGDDLGADCKIHFAKDKLYGREEELAQCRELFQAYDTAAAFVSGCAGSGKSRLVEEFVAQSSSIKYGKPSILFLRSKSEALRGSVPFSSIQGIFDSIDQSVSDEIVELRELKILKLGKNNGHREQIDKILLLILILLVPD